MIAAITAITFGILATSSFALLCFGVNLLYLTWSSTRIRKSPGSSMRFGDEPDVCVQIPIYNERYVAERVIDAVCEMEWPRDRVHVQVLDDSDDETSLIVSRRAARWRARGLDVIHVRRGTRDGFKAGALAHGLNLTGAPFIAIFDADFVPPRDFLRRTMGVFEDRRVGFAQARWGHLDEGYSWFTRLQALAIDFHFLIEQAVRSDRGYFTNFTGTAGVWRREAIEDAGGWSAATLTEDLDLSYRAQLRGWRAAYVEDLVVPEELPVSIDAYRRQQSRWATGSFQSAFLLMGPVLRSSNRAAVKFQAAVHLVAYGVGPVMLLQLACYPLLLVIYSRARIDVPWQLEDASLLAIAVGASPWVGFMVAQTRQGRSLWAGVPAVLCQLVGAGMSFNTLLALARATHRGGEFVRTPKYRIVERGQEWRDQAYVRVGDPKTAVEAALGLSSLAIVPVALVASQYLVAIYSGLFAVGFLTVAAISLADLLHRRADGRTLRGRLRALADRRQPRFDRPPPRSSVRHGGHLAARLSRARGRRPSSVRVVAARRVESPRRVARAGDAHVRLLDRAQRPPGTPRRDSSRAQSRLPVHVGLCGRRAADDCPARRRVTGRDQAQHATGRPARCPRCRHGDQGVDLDRRCCNSATCRPRTRWRAAPPRWCQPPPAAASRRRASHGWCRWRQLTGWRPSLCFHWALSGWSVQSGVPRPPAVQPRSVFCTYHPSSISPRFSRSSGQAHIRGAIATCTRRCRR